MTECKRPALPFATAKRRPLLADFSGGHITSDAGALLLREADRQLGLTAALDAAIPDPRHPDLITHPQRTLLAQRLFALACGYEDLNDHQHLRDDPLWQIVADHPGSDRDTPVSLASPPTLCRLENRIMRPTLVRLAEVLVEQFLASYDTPPEHLTLDFDATDDPVHGRQEPSDPIASVTLSDCDASPPLRESVKPPLCPSTTPTLAGVSQTVAGGTSSIVTTAVFAPPLVS